ncbi:MAG: SSU ribosomal protein S8p (S15Ae) [Candidatus Woesebacteria bacterium]|jgi:small subunit ribosomal protein S8|nr:MAG: SSU ribosomal protein S8p (S15Ae) [Candidatus Woesebacteria bacterium]
MRQTNYTVGDFLITIKNAALANKKTVEVKESKMTKAVAEALLKLGFLSSVEPKDGLLFVSLAYKKKAPILSDIKLVSKPSLRVYWDLKKLKEYRSPAVLLLSTSKGILSSKEALKEGLGGEVIAEVL